jgi:carotenoid 1,2-hydratase
VFSPYYAWARGAGQGADAENHCCLNVALYGAGGSRWAMTERGRRWVDREARQFRIGPSRMHWDGQALVVDVDEITVPIPRRLRGRVRLIPQALCSFNAPLDAGARHRWGPIAPCSRIEVDFDKPGLSWKGHAYLDSNEGDEPIDCAFRDWDWSRATLADGSTAVIYDVRPKAGGERVIAQRFATDGTAIPFETHDRQRLPRSLWGLPRSIRNEPAGPPASVLETLEDTPFYVRSTLQATMLGERVTAIHESLDVPRVVSRAVRLMLPWRMPRRG